MGWGNAVAAGINATNQLINTGLSSFLSYDANRKLQQKQMKWQEKMSNTAHQREVKDLREAGLNPILSATGGAGATTPSGAGASADMEVSMGDAYGTYLQYEQQEEQNNLLKQQQNTEQATQEEKTANAALMNANRIFTDKQASWYDKRQATELKQLGQSILESQAKISLMRSQITTEKTLQDLKRAETRYTNERSRGYSRDVKLPFGFGFSSSGNSWNPYDSNKGKWIKEKDKYGRDISVFSYY